MDNTKKGRFFNFSKGSKYEDNAILNGLGFTTVGKIIGCATCNFNKLYLPRQLCDHGFMLVKVEVLDRVRTAGVNFCQTELRGNDI
jgi:hypothetical protein